MRRLLDVARYLGERGYWVFPLAPAGKRPICHGGVNAATRAERELLHWWDRTPDANVGINDGASGLLVVDIDPKAGADPDEVLEELSLQRDHLVHVETGEAPEPDEQHPDSLAGVRGLHVPFRAPGVASVPKTSITGVELRAAGLYTVAPGSRHPSGVLYEGELPPVCELPGPPASVFALHSAGSSAFGSGMLIRPPEGESITSPRAPQFLHHVVHVLLGDEHLVGGALLERMLAENTARVVPPLPRSEVARLWRWANKSKAARYQRWLASLGREPTFREHWDYARGNR